jgi:hypothetical protein
MKSAVFAAPLLALSAWTADARADCGPLGAFVQWIESAFVADMDGESIPTSDLACDDVGSGLSTYRYDMDGESIPTSDSRYDMDGESIPTSD